MWVLFCPRHALLLGVPNGTVIIICDKNAFVNTFSKKIKGVNNPPCMRVGTKPTINNLAVEFATLLSIICNKNTFVNTFSKK